MSAGASVQTPSEVEASLGLDRPARRLIQQGLGNEGFDPGVPDGLFGPRTREAIRRWQDARGVPATGYLDGEQAGLLRVSGAPPTSGSETVEPAATPAEAPAAVTPDSAFALRPPPETGAVAAAPPAVSAAAIAEQENLFWQSIMNSTNPAEFEAYLAQFPSGTFRPLAEARLAALRAPPGEPSAAAADADARLEPGAVFRDCGVCPEMVVMPGGLLALGRYEVTVGEYDAFVSAADPGPDDVCIGVDGDSWRDPGYPQTDRHPVSCVSWNDAQAYVAWLSRRAGAAYRLPTASEWRLAVAGTQAGAGCYEQRTGTLGTCPVGSYGANDAGFYDLAGNVMEWTQDCVDRTGSPVSRTAPNCTHRVLRGDYWRDPYRPLGSAGSRHRVERGLFSFGLRVAKTLGAP